MTIFPAVTLLLAMQPNGCVLVTGERILAKDIAIAVPEAAQLAPDHFLGYAPAPGLRRLLKVPGGTRPICLEWPMRRLRKEEVAAAVALALDAAGTSMEIADFSRHPVPPGAIEFPRSSLSVSRIGSKEPVALWRGRIRYAKDRYYPIWAKVAVERSRPCVVVKEAVRAGSTLTPEQLSVEAECTLTTPFQETFATVEEVSGKVTRRWLPAATPLISAMVEAPPEIERGQTIEVEAEYGAVRFKMPAKAAATGRTGDSIKVTNMESGKTFPAKVVAPGKVRVSGGSAK